MQVSGHNLPIIYRKKLEIAFCVLHKVMGHDPKNKECVSWQGLFFASRLHYMYLDLKFIEKDLIYREKKEKKIAL